MSALTFTSRGGALREMDRYLAALRGTDLPPALDVSPWVLHERFDSGNRESLVLEAVHNLLPVNWHDDDMLFLGLEPCKFLSQFRDEETANAAMERRYLGLS